MNHNALVNPAARIVEALAKESQDKEEKEEEEEEEKWKWAGKELEMTNEQVKEMIDEKAESGLVGRFYVIDAS
jgi:hypothetical protein